MKQENEYQDLSIYKTPSDFRGRGVIIVQMWWIVQNTIFAWSPQFCYGFRRFILRLFGCKVGKNVLIRPSVKIQYPWKVCIGDYTWIGDDTVLYSLGEITIGKHVSIAHRDYFCTGLHDHTKVSFDIDTKPIIIEDECWIPNDVFVGPGVTIKKGCVIGARSTVLHDMPEGMICYGAPAKPVRKRK